MADYTNYDDIPKRFKCDQCNKRGLTLIENERNFKCACGNIKPKTFWHKTFRNAPETMTLRKASEIIGADPKGSTLRRALLENRLTTVGRIVKSNGTISKREHLIGRDDLIKYYLTHYRHKRGHKDEGTGRSNGSQPTD